MRCLNCRREGIALETQVCPQCGVHLPSLMRDLLPTGTLLDGEKYRIDYALGQGGFGITYRAADMNLERPVAIKEFYPQAYVQRDPLSGTVSVSYSEADTYGRWLGRFEREGRILARLSHPGIVKVYSLFKENQTAYLVMELLQGRTLRDELDAQSGKKLAPERVVTLATEMVSALDTVHREGVYHLDLKPDNVMLTGDRRIVLVDFGAARQDFGKDPKQKSSTRAMTPRYAPLELLSSQPVGPESDLFELGMILCEALTGECPPAVLDRLSQERWEPENVPEPWQGLLVEALQLQKANRPQSVAQWWQGYALTEPVVSPSTIPVISSPPVQTPPPVEPLIETVVSPPPVAEVPPVKLPEKTPIKPEVRSTQVEPAQLQRDTKVALPAAQPKSRETQVESPQRLPIDRPLVQGMNRRQLIFLGVMGTGAVGVTVIGSLLNQNSGTVTSTSPESPSTSPVPAATPPDSPSTSPVGSGAQPLTPAASPATYSYEAVGENEQRQQKTSRYFTEGLGGGVQLEMVEVPAGEFLMGSPASEAGRSSDEGPQHRVSIPKFYMGRFEVTQTQWQAVMGNNPSNFKGNDRPVEQVSWNDAQEFCKKLSQRTGRTYRLPSEAEWEYACRAGTTTAYYFGNDASKLKEYAWFAENSGSQTHSVGSFIANGFGLHDMHGNVWEWCQDVWHGNYNGAPTNGSAWVVGGDGTRLLRGGSWFVSAQICRSAIRTWWSPDNRDLSFGLRLVVSPPGL
jgi:eukaryotic-like serine/threonine-protein kinase